MRNAVHGIRLAAMEEFLHVAPRHHPDQAGARSLGDRHRPDQGTVAQDGDRVAQLEDLLHPVGNVDHRHAFAGEAADDVVQPQRLAHRQGGGGLVHDQDAGVERKGLGDLDQLLLADPQRPHQRCRRGTEIQRLQQLRRRPLLASAVDEERSPDHLRAQEDVVGHRHARHQVQLLMDDRQPVSGRIAGAAEPHGLAVDGDLALVVGIDAAGDLHQRRLAGAVLAHQGMDLAGVHGEIDTLEHRHPTEGFADAAHAEKRRTVGAAAADRFSSLGPRDGLWCAARSRTPASLADMTTNNGRNRYRYRRVGLPLTCACLDHGHTGPTCGATGGCERRRLRRSRGTMHEPSSWHGTTILSVRKGSQVAMAGDGQVSFNQTVMKANARKVRTLGGGDIIAGFAGSTADAFTLLERLEAKLERHPGQLTRACVELAKDWRTDRYLRRLEAMMAVADREVSLVLTGNGDVLEPEDGLIGIGSGGSYALAAAKALLDIEGLVPNRSPARR